MEEAHQKEANRLHQRGAVKGYNVNSYYVEDQQEIH